MDSPLSAQQCQEFVEWFGPGQFRDVDGSNSFYQANGSFGRWCRTKCQIDDYVYACTDFGTYSSIRMLKTLRQENRCYHWSQPDSELTRQWKRKSEEVFCPQSLLWREASIVNAEELIRKAMEGLRRSPSV